MSRHKAESVRQVLNAVNQVLGDIPLGDLLILKLTHPCLSPIFSPRKKLSAIRGLLWLMEKDAALAIKKERNDEGG